MEEGTLMADGGFRGGMGWRVLIVAAKQREEGWFAR